MTPQSITAAGQTFMVAPGKPVNVAGPWPGGRKTMKMNVGKAGQPAETVDQFAERIESEIAAQVRSRRIRICLSDYCSCVRLFFAGREVPMCCRSRRRRADSSNIVRCLIATPSHIWACDTTGSAYSSTGREPRPSLCLFAPV